MQGEVGQNLVGIFFLGIGGSPLPYSPAVLLPHTGDSMVAVINWSAVGIGHPAPRATLAGGAVELQWPVPEQAPGGCHLYRRDEAALEIRLTDQPLSGYGSILTYTDRPGGYAAGSVLYYSYTVVADGVESARSLETEIRLTNMPALTTRLLPNVPNPFNPMTEIRFELAGPGLGRPSGAQRDILCAPGDGQQSGSSQNHAAEVAAMIAMLAMNLNWSGGLDAHIREQQGPE